MEPEQKTTGLAALLTALGAFTLLLALLANEWTLAFLYADGKLVRDAIARIRTVQAGLLGLGLLLALAGALLRMSSRALSGRAASHAVAVVLLLYLPVLGELGFSLLRPGQYAVWDPFGLCRTSIAVDDRQLGHVLNPELDHSYSISPRGFRGADFPSPKPPDEVRILAVGDSITFGWELSEDRATYPGQLQALLDGRSRPGRRFRVVNAGVPRYTSEQVVRLLRLRLAELQPDLVVLCVGWNDLAFSYRPDWYPRISFTGRSRARYCRGFSPAVLRVVRNWKGEDDDDEPRVRRRLPHPQALSDFRDNLLEIVALLEGRGVGLLLVNLPSVLSRSSMSDAERALASRFPEIENLAQFEGVVREVCRDAGVACLLDAFALDQTDKGRYFYDHCHLNREGNVLFARKILEAIEVDPRLRARVG